jgi:hydrogenase maturation factor
MTERIPRIGDWVFLHAKHGGPFLVVAVYAATGTVDVKPVKGNVEMPFVDKGIPWRDLTFADKKGV